MDNCVPIPELTDRLPAGRYELKVIVQHNGPGHWSYNAPNLQSVQMPAPEPRIEVHQPSFYEMITNPWLVLAFLASHVVFLVFMYLIVERSEMTSPSLDDLEEEDREHPTT